MNKVEQWILEHPEIAAANTLAREEPYDYEEQPERPINYLSAGHNVPSLHGCLTSSPSEHETLDEARESAHSYIYEAGWPEASIWKANGRNGATLPCDLEAPLETYER